MDLQISDLEEMKLTDLYKLYQAIPDPVLRNAQEERTNFRYPACTS